MAKPSLAALKAELEDACKALRGFTLGHNGCETQRSGIAAMQRVSEICDRLVATFKSGSDAARAAVLASGGRTRVLAAQYRLDLLRGKPGTVSSKSDSAVSASAASAK